MAGRPKKQYGKLKRPVYVELKHDYRFLLAWVIVVCPLCGSDMVGTNGTRRRKNGRVECFQCHNPRCPFRKQHKRGKQFVLTKSGKFRAEVHATLGRLYDDLVHDGANYKTIAKKYHISVPGVAALRAEFERGLKARRALGKLVAAPVLESAVAIDETFLKIEGTTIYVIIATGYTSRKILAVRVSESRAEGDIAAVIAEAEKNTKEKPSTYTSDAWGATGNAIKHLGRSVTHVIHRHKRPYKKAVVRRIEYTETERVITDVGVKVDVFECDGKREYRYAEHPEPLQPPAPRPRGRPNGVKNGQGKKKKAGSKKRGPRGLFAVFKKGLKGYLAVNMSQHVLKLAAGCSIAVTTALNHAFALFAGMSIQNNLSETVNGVLAAIMRPRGPRTAKTLEQRLRARIIVRNDPSALEKIKITLEVHGDFFLRNVAVADYARLGERGWEIDNLSKISTLT